ncbi:TonB-dependent siderophore receptor [Herbaspirillum sp. RV1423]|uniref:TonB-dependent siderophore receptor n=1 Tax=Herbaspirillum sp. RV1423 TaxID=1443993 RepID=UPI0004BACD65|nr:TonB-dependent siderophore receptor [Herbaspirillum sp. RV1423]
MHNSHSSGFLPAPLVVGLYATASLFIGSSARAADAADAGTSLPEVVVTTPADTPDATRGYQPRRSEVSSGRQQDIQDIPQSVAVVSSTVIEDQQARSLDDILGNISGIIQTNTLGGTRDSFLKRGFGSNDDGSILRDGVRSPILHNYTATIDRVEVLKGPASLLYGIQGPGGVINMITRKPEDAFAGSVSLTRSSDSTRGVGFDLTGPIGKPGEVAGGTLAYRLIGEYNEANYWRSSGRQRDGLIAPSLAWHDAATSISISYQHVDYTTPFDRGTLLIKGRLDDSLRKVRYEEPWAQNTGTQETVNAGFEHKLSEQWRLRGNYGWSSDRYDQYLTRARTLNNTTGILSRSSDANLGRNDSGEIATLSLLGDVNLAGLRHELAFSGEYERQRDFRGDTIRGNAVNGFNIYQPVYGLIAPGGTVNAAQSDSMSRVTSYSLISQDSVHLTDRLIAVGGLRWENYQQLSGVGRPFVVADNSHGQVWLPQFGLVYKLSQALSLYGNFSKSFVPNVSSSALQPLAPERGRVYETGLKFELQPGITGTLAVYQIDKSNVAVTVGEITTTIGKARSRGAELDIAGQISRNWSVIGNYAYTDAVNQDGNVPLANVPRHSGGLFAVYKTTLPYTAGQWRFGGGERFVGNRPGDTTNSFTLPGYAVTDAFAAYETKIDRIPTKIQLNVKNLFNKTYYPSSSSNLIVAVGDPRTVTLSTTFSF